VGNVLFYLLLKLMTVPA